MAAGTSLLISEGPKKNASAGKVFEEIGFDVVGEQEGVLSLTFPKEKAVSQEGIVRIVEAKGVGA